MKQRMVKSFTRDPNGEFVTHREVAGGESSRMMHLPEEDRLCRPVQASPPSHAPLKGSPSGVGKVTRLRLLQPVKQGHRFQRRFVLKLPLNLRPDVLEGIDPGAVFARQFVL